MDLWFNMDFHLQTDGKLEILTFLSENRLSLYIGIVDESYEF